MKIRSRSRLLLALILSLAAASPANAQLKITEVMSSSGGSGAMANDWFELTNFGASSANITGYRMDDDSNNVLLSVPLLGVTSIAPGESVVFFNDVSGNISTFRSFWGGIAATIQIGNYTGSGTGLGSGGDQVHVFDSGNVSVDGVSFGAATSGVSFGYNKNTSTFGALSVVGQYGAYQSANALHNVGSPGAIPEPAVATLMAAAGALGYVVYRGRKVRKA